MTTRWKNLRKEIHSLTILKTVTSAIHSIKQKSGSWEKNITKMSGLTCGLQPWLSDSI